MKFPRQNISASLINCYMDCPLAFKLLHVDGLLPEEGPALEIGTMLDFMFKCYHQKKDWHTEAKEKFLSGRYSKQKIDNFGIAKSLMEVYIKDPDTFVNPTFDIGFKLPIINPVNGEKLEGYFLTGFLDGFDEGRVKELKSTSEPYTQERVDLSIQGTIYAYYAYHTHKKLCPVDYIVIGKKTKKVDRFSTTRTVDDFATLFENVKHFIELVEKEEFDMNPNHPFYCPCRKL